MIKGSVSAERSVEIAAVYYNDLLHYILPRPQNEYDVEDIVQDIFLLFQERYANLNDDNIRAWLYKVADNKTKEKYRKIAKQEKIRLLSLFPGYEKALTLFMKWKKIIK